MLKSITSLILLFTLSFSNETNTTQNFETINVEGKEQKSVFMAQDYLDTQTFMQEAPSQRKLSIAEAMNVPGIMGDPIKALRVLAGVTSAGSSGEMIVHASKSSETLSTMNHLPLGYLFHFNGLHSVISPEATDQLDLYLGGFDNTYNYAMGGVLDITPKYPMGDNSGFVHLGIFDSSFGVDVKITDDTSLYIGGRRSYFDVFLPTLMKLAEKQQKEDDDDNLTLKFTQYPVYWDTTVLLSHTMGNNQLSYEMVVADDGMGLVIDGNAEDPKANGPLDMAQGFITNGFRWKYDNYDDYKANTLVYYLYAYSRLNIFTQTVDTSTHFTGLKHISTLESDKHEYSAGFDLQAVYAPLDLNIMKPPAPDEPQGKFTDAPVFKVKQEVKLALSTIFAQDIYSFADDWKLRYGITHTYSTFHNFKHNVDPRMAISYKLTPNDEFSFAGGAYTQAPINGAYIVEEMGNPDLYYEHSYHATAHYKHNFSKTHYFEIEPYYKTYEQLAITDTTNIPSKNYLSVGTGDANGIDFTYKYTDDSFYVLASYTWVNSYRQLESADPTLYPFYAEIPHTLNVVGSYKLNSRWTFSGLLKLQSGQRYTPVIGATKNTYIDDNSTYYSPIYGEQWSKQFNPYFTLNLKAAYTQKLSDGERIEYAFELMNATNHQNEASIEYEEDFSNWENPTMGYDLPIIPWFDITYYF